MLFRLLQHFTCFRLNRMNCTLDIIYTNEKYIFGVHRCLLSFLILNESNAQTILATKQQRWLLGGLILIAERGFSDACTFPHCLFSLHIIHRIIIVLNFEKGEREMRRALQNQNTAKSQNVAVSKRSKPLFQRCCCCCCCCTKEYS